MGNNEERLKAKAEKVISDLYPPSVESGYFTRAFTSKGDYYEIDDLHRGMVDFLRDFAYEVIDHIAGGTT